MTEETIFAKAAEISDSGERKRYLDRACNGDKQLRARIEALVSAIDADDSLLDQPLQLDETATLNNKQQYIGVGGRIGPYKLLEEIGEGGMGIVFVAEREHPVRQRVALKVIKPGMDSREVIARFEAERQALALMDHPNVAKVLDAGTTESGQPYFVMEHIKGVSITEYCDEHNLSTRERLQLFKQVCQGVQHSHQKGIIHRDLKPSNILIAEYDQEAVVKIIDFGVAKALYQSLTDKTLYTKRLNIVGTLQYMSPEQAKMNQRDIDTRSDVYALGVVLYELLTSRPPFERKTLEDAGLEGMCKIIREQEPPKPSARMLTMEAKTATDVAKRRSSQVQLLSKSFKGDLDWIVMKALEKDRNRRYETANGLSKDIERYLANEGVTATPPTVGYRLWKTYSRNKGAFWAGGAFAALLLVATIVSATGWASSIRNANRYQAELEKSQEAKKAADESATLALASAAAEKRATSEAKKMENVASAVNQFLVENFILAVAPSDDYGRGRDAKLRDVILIAVENLDQQTKPGSPLSEEPLVEATIRTAIGSAFTDLGELEFAEEQLTKAVERFQVALDPTDPVLLNARLLLGEAIYWQVDRDRTGAYFNELVADCRIAQGNHGTVTLWARFWLAGNARPRLYDELIDVAKTCEQKGNSLNELKRLAYVAAATGTRKDRIHSLSLLEKAEIVQAIPQPRSKLSSMMFRWQQAYSYNYAGNVKKAGSLYGKLLPEVERLLGKNHSIYRNVLNNLSLAQLSLGDITTAKSNLLMLMDLTKSVDEKLYKTARQNFAYLLIRQEKWLEASNIYLEDYREFDQLSFFPTALECLRAIGEDEKANQLLADEKRAKIEAIKKGALKEKDFTDNLLGFAYYLCKAGEFETVVELSEPINESMDLVSKHHPTWEYYFGLNEATSKQFMAEQTGNIGQLRQAIEQLEKLDVLAEAEFERKGLENFYQRVDPFVAKSSLARAYMHDEIYDLEKAENKIFDAYFGFMEVRPKDSVQIGREVDRLLLLTGRSKGEQQQRFIERVKETLRNNPTNALMARFFVDHLHSLGANKVALEIIDDFDWEKSDQFHEALRSTVLGVKADVLVALGRNKEARQLALRLRAKEETDRHWRYDLILGEIARREGRLDEAEKTLFAALLDESKYGGDGFFKWKAARSLREVIKTRLERGEDPNEFHCVRLAESIVDEGTLRDLRAGAWVFLCLVWNDEFEVSQRLARKYVERREKDNVVRPVWHALSLDILGHTLLQQGQFEEALPYLQKGRRYVNDWVPPENWYAHLTGLVGDCKLGMKQFEEAEELILSAFNQFYHCYSPNWTDNYDDLLEMRIESCVRLYKEWNAAEPSDELKQKLKHWQAEQQRIAKLLEPNEEIEK